MTNNILAIGDIHGRSIWKDIIKHYINYERINKIVFVGDYVDSFDISADEQIKNLRDIINFKLQNKNSVELLIGNHDIQYYLPLTKLIMVKCSGFQEEKYFDYHNIFRNYKELFNISYQFKNYIFTHAGIHRGWYNYRFKEFHLENETLSQSLNREFHLENDVLFDCGYKRGGSFKSGGPLWADKSETYSKPLTGYHQIIGHTITSNIKYYKKNSDTSVTYIDTQNTQIKAEENGLLIKIKDNGLWETQKIKTENL